jgi:DNA (cytosine-5)-methyltransferase 1
MRYLSVCSGIEAATVAWHPLGFEPVAFAEIEAFPSAVLAHHYPTVPNWGDMSKFKDWPDANVDVLVGGTPCQSFSVAGLRKGLDDPRGNLALTYIALLRRYRPRWMVWENVPGVLSSSDGGDFRAFLSGLAGWDIPIPEGGWQNSGVVNAAPTPGSYGLAWGMLDAQYTGLAQRRKRVFVVGYLGDWRRAAAVLFERESLSGHPAPRREAGSRVAYALGASPASHERPNVANGQGNVVVSATLTARFAKGFGYDGQDLNSGLPFLVSPTVTSKWAKGSGGPAGSEHQNLAPIGIDNAVRRLTPRECERLQGFPDDYTLCPYRGKPAADGPRYKALGNSMAVPCMSWIGRRIKEVDSLDVALGAVG